MTEGAGPWYKPDPAEPSPEEVRWLHDTLERRAMHDDNLLAQRANFYATLSAALIAGELLAFAYGLPSVKWFGDVQTVIAFLGVLVSAMWWLTIERTVAGQAVWRKAVIELERRFSPYGKGTQILWEVPQDIWPGWPQGLAQLNLAWPIDMHNSVFHERMFYRFELSRSPNSSSRLIPLAACAAWMTVLVTYSLTLVYLGVVPLLSLLLSAIALALFPLLSAASTRRNTEIWTRQPWARFR